MKQRANPDRKSRARQIDTTTKLRWNMKVSLSKTRGFIYRVLVACFRRSRRRVTPSPSSTYSERLDGTSPPLNSMDPANTKEKPEMSLTQIEFGRDGSGSWCHGSGSGPRHERDGSDGSEIVDESEYADTEEETEEADGPTSTI